MVCVFPGLCTDLWHLLPRRPFPPFNRRPILLLPPRKCKSQSACHKTIKHPHFESVFLQFLAPICPRVGRKPRMDDRATGLADRSGAGHDPRKEGGGFAPPPSLETVAYLTFTWGTPPGRRWRLPHVKRKTPSAPAEVHPAFCGTQLASNAIGRGPREREDPPPGIQTHADSPPMCLLQSLSRRRIHTRGTNHRMLPHDEGGCISMRNTHNCSTPNDRISV
jgi:hypothetical protein